MKIKKTIGAAAAALLALSVAACSGGGDEASESPGGGGGAEPGEQVELTVWAWEPTLADVVPAFEEANPDIKVDLQNVGGAADTYTQIDNALAAGSGAPDIAQIEYYAVAQYAIPGQVADLSQFGADGLADEFTPGTWDAVTLAGGDAVYGLPMDSGPMALFYNEAVFQEAGIAEPPTTWEEFYDAAVAIRELGDNYYITSDNGDAGLATSMMWLAGGAPFGIDGDQVTIDLGDEGVVAYADFWQRLIEEDLINTTVSPWSDDWFRGLGDGTIASLMTGAWMPANLIGSAPDASGDFRVAPMPTPEDGQTANAENGGSSLAILAASEKQEAAYRFLEFNSTGEGADIRVQGGNFPSAVATLEDEEYLSYTDEYFGGQEYNRVLAEASANVVEGWSYLPFQVYANSIYGDKIGPAFSGSKSVGDALMDWQADLESYAQENGFMNS